MLTLLICGAVVLTPKIAPLAISRHSTSKFFHAYSPNIYYYKNHQPTTLNRLVGTASKAYLKLRNVTTSTYLFRVYADTRPRFLLIHLEILSRKTKRITKNRPISGAGLVMLA